MMNVMLKDELRQVYQDLRNGELSKEGALARIRDLKRRESPEAATLVLAAPAWTARAASGEPLQWAGRHIVLCGFDHIDTEQFGQCVRLPASPQGDASARYSHYALCLFDLVQTLLKSRPQGKVLLQLVVSDGAAQGLTGLLRTAAYENPQLTAQVVMLSSDVAPAEMRRRLDAELHGYGDAVVSYRSGVRQVLCWNPAQVPQLPTPAFKDNGVYLITGGLGGLGQLFMREILATTSQAKVILTGRLALDAVQRATLDALGRVRYAVLDLLNPAQVKESIAALQREHGALNGIIHGAGMTADAHILNKSAAQFSRVLEPKVAGTVSLDDASAGIALDFFAVFSSIAGALGNPAQSDYAAANGFLDQFAAHRQRLVDDGQRHGKTVSLNWPLWQDGGMRIDAASQEIIERATGMQPMQTGTGMRAFHAGLNLPGSQVLVMAGDPQRIKQVLVTQNLIPVHAKAPAPAVPLDAPAPADLLALTQDHVRKQLASILKLSWEKIDPRAAWEEYGFDSILAVKLINQLEQSFGPLSKTLFFEYHTTQELSQYLVQSHGARLHTLFAPAALPPAKARPQRAPEKAAPRTRTEDAVAIIGLSGRYPESDNLDSFWRNLRDGKDCITEVPKSRWNWQEYYTDDRQQAGHHYSKWGGFISGVDEFDPLFFNISPRDAKTIDPQERLFLQHAWMAMEDAGYTRAGLHAPSEGDLPGQVGVYAGLMYSEYQLFAAEASANGNRVGIPGSFASIANRVSYAFNLHGPSMTVDTMCSSSLTAIHLACQDLKLGRTTMAIAGGVNVSVHPNKYLMLSAGQFISGDGHCQSFGEGGDGYIPGEGVGVVILKSLSKAQVDGDHIYGIIRGSAVNHGGKTNGYTVPNPQAQASVIGRALADANIDPRQISYIEAHGTGTKLGDPIEIAALTKAFHQHTKDTGFCYIGSAKSNIGHCESAAGIAGLSKILLQMQHRQIAPSLHSARLNPHIDFASTPFVVNQQLRDWEAPVVDGRTLARVAGLSSFGAGGSNAHLVIEEYIAPARAASHGQATFAFPLSARTAEQLRQKVRDLLDFLSVTDAPDLAAIAFTLQTGREAMEHRLGFVATSAGALREQLQAVCDGKNGLAIGNDAPALAMWVNGGEPDWDKLYGETRPVRVSLPTYPFAKGRYWVDELLGAKSKGPAKLAVLHPLLHANTSSLQEQRYSATFSGDEFFFADNGPVKVLSGAAYLEMARAALELAMPVLAQTSILELRNVAWGLPFTAGPNKQLHIALIAGHNGQVSFEIYGSDDNAIHCQGSAAHIAAAPAQRLDVAGLEQLIVAEQGEYVLHPAMLEQAFQSSNLLKIEMVRIVFPPGGAMFASRRSASDIDLCDADGNVRVQMRGVTYQRRQEEAPAPVAKTAAISLAAPELVARSASAGRAAGTRVALRSLLSVETALVTQNAHSDGVFSLRIDGPSDNMLSAELVDALLQALERVQQEPSLKVLLMHGSLQGGRIAIDAALEKGFYRAIAAFSCPVIAVVQRETHGAGMLLAALCDFIVCNSDANFSFPDVRADEQHLFRERFGNMQTDAFLQQADGCTGAQLKAMGFTCQIVPGGQVDKQAHALAADLASKPQLALRLLKQHLARHILTLAVTMVPAVEEKAVKQTKARMPVSTPNLRLTSHADRLLLVTFKKKKDKTRLATVLAELSKVLDEAQAAGCPGIVLASDEAGFLAHGVGVDDVAVAGMIDLLLGTALPVIAALPGDTRGNAWLLAQFCDACVYAENAGYAFDRLEQDWQQPRLAAAAAAIFPHRFGNVLGSEILLTGRAYEGQRLRSGNAVVVDAAQVLPAALDVARSWKRQATASWKTPFASGLATAAHGVPTWSGSEQQVDVTPAAVALESKVVTASMHPGGILEVRMEEREAKNMFSEELAQGLHAAFAHVENSPGCKVVVLTGYDSYFASGGTKDNLIAIQEGKVKFTDNKVYELALRCKVPVIAAMQGHGIGAGWCLGMFADFTIFSEESQYLSPYMNYGFTPGAGATFIFPEKVGYDLARESLLTARAYTGSALRLSGMRVPVLPQAQVVGAALDLARELARSPLSRLKRFKHLLVQPMLEPLEQAYRREVELHEQTFVGQAGTLRQIHQGFLNNDEAVAPVAKRSVAAAPARSLSEITTALRKMLADELHMEQDEVGEHTEFIDMGMDSITGVTWIRKISERYQVALEATKVYSYPTLAKISLHVQELLGPMPEAVIQAPPAAPEAVALPVHGAAVLLTPLRRTGRQLASAATEPIAVIGMAGQFPQAKNIDEFWRNIAEGRNCITEVEPQRWSIDTYYRPGEPVPGKTNSRWLGALDDYAMFDPLFFNISPGEAQGMDPQQRLFLEACWHSIENAGYNPRALSGVKCGVFAGCASGDYQLLSEDMRLSAQGFTGGASSILAARISYFLNLQGPCVSIDTACSSSLVAMANACDSLNAGNSDLALAGGVYVMVGAEMQIKTAQAGMLSTDGRCHTFDQRANGFVPGEAVGVVVLKRLADAERDGDPIHGVIQGWGINQDGKTNGITAPNPQSQTRLQQEVYDKFRIDPTEIQLIEAHGTGTKLGDPIEVEALKASFKKYTGNRDYCALGSVKSNIGHCLTAAGIASFIKLMLALKHQQLPPTINFEQLNEHIGLKDSPFYVNRSLQAWTPNGNAPRQAAISSFGFSGTNAHLVVKQYLAPATAKLPVSVLKQDNGVAFPLSAKTPGQLRRAAQNLLDYIQRDGAAADLLDIAYTLQVGREAMDERLCLLAGSIGELAQKLQAYVTGETGIAGLHQGQTRRDREGLSVISQDADMRETIVGKWIAQGQLGKLVALWAKGLEFDWNLLYGDVKPMRIALPTYPFARERYWIEAQARRAVELPQPVEQPVMEAAADESQEMFFQETWQQRPHKAVLDAAVEHRISILFVDAALEQAIAGDDKLRTQMNPIFVHQGDAYSRQSERSYTCRLDNRDDIANVLKQVAAEHDAPLAIAYGWAKEQQEAGVHSLFGLFSAIKASSAAVTQVTLIGRYDPAKVHTCWDYAWIGFERSLRLLMPSVRVSLLLTDSAACTPHQLLDASQGGVTWYREGQPQVLAIKEIDAPAANRGPVIKQGGNYVITGGTGALGLKFAHHLATDFKATLLLLGRRPMSATIQSHIDALLRAGAGAVHYHAVDMGDRDAVGAWSRTLSVPIAGVFHAAGNESFSPFHEKTATDIGQVLHPKTRGTQWLDDVLGTEHPLDFVCYFASSAALLGDFGSCDYAIANRFQMAYGEHRCRHTALRGKTMVINWPLWQEGGMGQGDPQQAAFYLKSSGQEALRGDAGIRIWQQLAQCDQLQTLVMVGKPARVEQFLSRIYPVDQPQHRPIKEQVLADLRQIVCTTLKIAPGRLENGINLADYGFDSIGLMAFAKQLGAHFGIDVTPAMFYTYSTVEQIASHFANDHHAKLAPRYAAGAPALVPAPQRRAAQVSAPQAAASPAPLADSIAIVGMSGRFPQAGSVDELWTLLAEQRSGIGEIPRARWNWRDYFVAPGHPHNRISTNLGGFIDGVDEFDPLFFEVSPREAEEMDPAERILLMEAYHAIEDARLSPAALRGSNMGVFVGMEESQYGLHADQQGVTTAGGAMISSRLSYFLDLHGPTIATNTACSSGLVALHQAAASLRQGECDSALVAGLALNLAPQAWVKMSEAGMLSETGQCYSFAKQANGIAIGDAVVVLMLKPLSAAQANGDRIYGTIKASGINFDGKTNGVTAPNGRMQAQLIEEVYTRAGIDVADISHIVAHGTGTKLGDPVEVNALNDAFRKLSRGADASTRLPCALTSPKSNLGHTLAASGLVSVVALLKGMEHQKIPGSLHCEEENDYISWEDSYFRVNKTTTDWSVPADKTRMGGVSAFGRSGTNAHVVIEQYRAPVHTAATGRGPEQVLVPLSARTPEQLQQRVRDLVAFIGAQKKVDLSDLAYTLQVAREAMDERLVLVVDSVEQLTERLDSWLAGDTYIDNLFAASAGQASAGMGVIGQDEDMLDAIGKWLTGHKLVKLAQLWVQGLDLDWSRLHQQHRPRTMTLPVYPFAKERYWIADAAIAPSGPRLVVDESGPLESIEEIINGIEDGSMETQQAIRFLKRVV